MMQSNTHKHIPNTPQKLVFSQNMFAKALSTVTTQNGAKSQGSTGSGRVNYFFKVLRSTPKSDVESFLRAADAESVEDAMKLVFQLRDCRGGKGERKPFIESLCWYLESGRLDIVRQHLKYIPYFGYWKDLNSLFGTAAEPDVIKLYTEMLLRDLDRLIDAREKTQTAGNDNENVNVSISLAAKWVPNENSEPDRKFKAAKKIAKALGVSMKDYRVKYLRPLRQHIKVVETFMCGKQWDKIKYGEVPSLCMFKHRKAFERNDPERFAAFIGDVERGEAKINAKQLAPHELVHHYLSGNGENDPTINAQWDALVEYYRSKGTLKNALCVTDVSGSMSCTLGGNTKSNYKCIDASIGLSLLIADCVEEPFRNQIITFSTDPKFHQVKGKTLKERVKDIHGAYWEMTTNFQAVFDMILKKAQEYRYVDSEGVAHKGVPEDQMPKTVFVFSDMQFNEAYFCPECQTKTKNTPMSGIINYTSGSCKCPPNQITNLEAIRMKYRKAGYTIPTIVFWNLNGSTPDFPATADDSGIALVSGFSPAIMKMFLAGVSMNPYNVMRLAIDDPRYDVICGSEDKSLSELYYGTHTQDTGNGVPEDVKVIKV